MIVHAKIVGPRYVGMQTHVIMDMHGEGEPNCLDLRGQQDELRKAASGA